MTKAEIEKVGTNFMNEECDDILFDPKECARRGFIAGAEFRQEEIDELVDILKRLLSHNYDYEAINIGNELLKKYEYEMDNV